MVGDEAGSSPLARGLQVVDRHLHLGLGIIPARAGFTPGCPYGRHATRDHPRSRGVYRWLPLHGVQLMGSSPLARGLLKVDGSNLLEVGIIPARAGFTPTTRGATNGSADHPRSRGVYRLNSRRLRIGRGSSPLARGLHLAIGVIPTVGHPTRGRSPSLVT